MTSTFFPLVSFDPNGLAISADDVLTAVTMVVAIVAVGFLLRHTRVLPDEVAGPLDVVTRRVAAPCMYFTVAAGADVPSLWSRSSLTLVVTCAAGVLLGIAGVAARGRVSWPEIAFRSGAGASTSLAGVGFALASATFGNLEPLVPVLVIQVLVLGPALTAARRSDPGPGPRARGRAWIRANPALVPVLVGLALATLWPEAPSAILDPLESLGNASIPLVLLSLGMSWPAPGRHHPDRAGGVLWGVLVSRAAMLPTLSWVVGRALGLDGDALVTVVAAMCLPLAHDIGMYAPTSGALRARTSRTVAVSTGVSLAIFPIAVLVMVP